MKLQHRIIAFGVGLLLLAASAACHHGPDDATITANVKAKLAADAMLAATPINVDTKDGVVTLTGTVASAAAVAQAASDAQSVEGVKSVTNNLTAKPAPTPPIIAADDPLKTQVTANLTKYGITGVTVTVANGEVTLTGDLPRAKLQDAMKAASEAHPKKVNNKLNLK
jgi:hyperosmotically inducible periplasmic protein